MAPYGNLTLGRDRRSSEALALRRGEKTHPGFDFASLAPSPLKVAKHEAQLAEISAPAPAAKPQLLLRAEEQSIEGDLDNAWSRLKRSINPDPPNRI